MWHKPWGYAEGTAVVAGLLATGLLLQFTAGSVTWELLRWPANVVAFFLFIFLITGAFLLRRQSYFCRFLTTVQAAVPAIAVAAFLTVVMGLVRQVASGRPAADVLGLTRMLRFWPFVLVYLWMSIIVGSVAVRQLAHFSLKALPSFLSHCGLFFALVCATLGSADKEHLKMYCLEHQPEWRALDEFQNVRELPIAIELNRFTIEEYPPKLMIADSLSKQKPVVVTIDKDFSKAQMQGWTVSVLKRIDNALPKGMAAMIGRMPEDMMSHIGMDAGGMKLSERGFEPYSERGAATALLVEAKKGKNVKRGWVSCGSYLFPYVPLRLSPSEELVMPDREPACYLSDINVYTKEGRSLRVKVEVNHPVTIGDWKIYQTSYDESMGKWSRMSVFELVRDPWLPAVYFGVALLFLGAVLMLFVSRERKDKEEAV